MSAYTTTNITKWMLASWDVSPHFPPIRIWSPNNTLLNLDQSLSLMREFASVSIVRRQHQIYDKQVTIVCAWVSWRTTKDVLWDAAVYDDEDLQWKCNLQKISIHRQYRFVFRRDSSKFYSPSNATHSAHQWNPPCDCVRIGQAKTTHIGCEIVGNRGKLRTIEINMHTYI